MATLYDITYLRDGEVLKALIWGESPERAAAYVEQRLGGRVMIVNGEGARELEAGGIRRAGTRN